jgi:MFS family permease
VTSDGHRILVAQAIRAFVYGFTSVLLGVTLAASGWSTTRVGILLAAILTGTALMSVLVGTYADRIGRRHSYAGLFVLLSVAGVVFAVTSSFWVLVVVAFTGALSTEVVESGPFTSLEQAMLPETVAPDRRTRMFGHYNAVATIAGSMGALAAGGPALLRNSGFGVGTDQHFFLVLAPAGVMGAIVARSLSAAVEASPTSTQRRVPLQRSRPIVVRLAALFAVDSFGGGFAVQSFLVFFLSRKFGLDTGQLGMVFFAVGFLQAGSFLAATRLGERFGLLNTMVFTHLPSNLLLAGIAFAPNAGVAIGLLLARFALSQMDVPMRQAYVTAMVDPDERVAASAYTSTARYVIRPAGPVLAGVAQQVSLGLPLLIAGTLKSVYDLTLWSWLRHVPLNETAEGVPDDRLLANRPRPA